MPSSFRTLCTGTVDIRCFWFSKEKNSMTVRCFLYNGIDHHLIELHLLHLSLLIKQHLSGRVRLDPTRCLVWKPHHSDLIFVVDIQQIIIEQFILSMETLAQPPTGIHHHGPIKIHTSLTSVVDLDLTKGRCSIWSRHCPIALSLWLQIAGMFVWASMSLYDILDGRSLTHRQRKQTLNHLACSMSLWLQGANDWDPSP